MKIKYADYPTWKNLEKKYYINKYFNTEDFKGNISLLIALKIKEKLIKNNNGIETVVFDNNFKWLELYPENNKNVAWHATMNDKDEIIHWFFDIAKDSLITEEGVPYIKDLYLDIVWYPSGEFKLEDEDELQEALNKGEITKEDFDLAYKVANEIIKELKGNTEKLKEFTYKYYALLKQ